MSRASLRHAVAFLGMLLSLLSAGCATPTAVTDIFSAPDTDRVNDGVVRTSLEVRWRHRLSQSQWLELRPREQARPAFDDQRVYAGGRDGFFFALDRDNRSVWWKTSLKPPLTGQPLAAAGMVYAADGNGYLNAFDAPTGQVVWRSYLGDECPGQPVMAQGVIYVRTASGQVQALTADTGKVLWRHTDDAPAGGSNLRSRSLAGPLVTDSMVITGTSQGTIIALNRETGAKLWVSKLAAFDADMPDAAAEPALSADGNRLFVALYDEALYCLLTQTGTVQWKNEEITRVTGMVEHEGVLVTAAGRRGVTGLDPVTGASLWELPLCNDKSVSPSPPVSFGASVLLSCNATHTGVYLLGMNGRNKPSVDGLLRPGNGVFSKVVPLSDKSFSFISNRGYVYLVDVSLPGKPPRSLIGDPQQSESLPTP